MNSHQRKLIILVSNFDGRRKSMAHFRRQIYVELVSSEIQLLY